MISDEQSLYLTLLVVCLLECVIWVPSGAVAFVRRGKGRARLALPSRVLRNNRGGVVLGRLLPGSASALVVPQWPVSLGARGVLAWVSESIAGERAEQDGAFRDPDRVGRVSARWRDVIVDGEVLITAASARLARAVASVVATVCGARQEDRRRVLDEELARRFDTAAVRRALSELDRETARLGTAAVWLAVVMLVLAPVAVIWLGLARVWPWAVAAVWLSAAQVAILGVRAHRRLAPEDRLERWANFVMQLLFPPSAVRAPEAIARSALHGFHPLAVAAVLLEGGELRAFAAAVILDAASPRRPACIHEDMDAIATEAEHRARLVVQLERVVREAGLDPAELTAPPFPEDGCQAFCPRCRSQYQPAIVTCEDCGGVPVVEFERREATAA